MSPLTLKAAVVALALASLASQALAAGTTHYRWINERGVPVHSDRPPPKGIDYEVISTGSTLKRIVPGEQGAVPPETTPSVGNDFQQVEDEATSGPRKNPELCQRARENMRALESSPVIQMRDDQGDLRTLSTAEREAERVRTQQVIDDYCE